MANIYSFSQVQTYNQCELKYRYKYLDKIKLEIPEETADLVLWDIVHKTLEKLYEDINNFKNISLEELLSYYYELWEEKKKEVYQTWSEIIIKWKWELQDYINRGDYYIKSYYEKHKPFDDIKVISTEQNIYFNINDNIKFRWIIDRLDKKWDDFIISDYKTNKNLPTEQKQEYIDQLTLYWLAIKQKYWKYLENIRAKLYFLHFDIEDERLITDNLLEEVVWRYKEIIDKIEIKRFNYNMWQKDEFFPEENPLCRFCEFQSICPVFSHAGMEDEVSSDITWKTIKTLVDEYAQLSQKANEIEKEKDTLKTIISDYAENKWLKKLYWNESAVSISKSINFKILDKDKTKDILEKKWTLDECLDLDRFKLSSMFKNSKLNLEDFADCVQKTQSFTLRKSSTKNLK